MIILASKSPRRSELLSNMGQTFRIITEEVDETLPDSLHPREGVRMLAVRKAHAVLPYANEGDIIISGDTLVELDGRALGKPADREEALNMLMSLSGKAHCVHSGICVLTHSRELSAVDTSRVCFKSFGRDTALDYIATGEPMDKAGAYGIQGLGGALVESVEGEMDTIVGLPCKKLSELLTEIQK